MVERENKYAKRRLRSSYLSTVVSIALVLFMLGLLGTIILYAKKLSDYVKENIELSIILNDKSKEADIVQFQKTLDAKDYIRSTEYITKEEAAERLTKELGEDFVTFLGYNPLLSSIDVRLVADYANSDSLANIEKQLSVNPLVQEVFYQKSLVDVINDNLKTISLIILGFSGLLFIIAIALINNTIRLAMYSKRFLIKSMQLVGATKGFIRRPFVWRGVLNGFYGALIALILLSGVLYMAQKQIPELFQLQDLQLVGTLFIGVIILGMFLSYLSTLMAVRRYLRSKLDDLYY
jgi:cell division transport system permease protein